MVRPIDPALVAAMSKPVWYPVLFVWLDWPEGEVRAHSNTGTLSWGGHDWTGVGRFGAISSPVEAPGLTADRITMTLAGLPPEILEMAGQPIRNRSGQVHVGATTEAGRGSLIGEPYRLIAGYMDALRYHLSMDGGATEHMLQLELGVGPSARAKATVLHSAEDQARRHPGDTAGRHLIEVAKRTQVMTWPE